MDAIFTVQDCENVAKKILKTDDLQTIDYSVVRLQNQNFLLTITVNHDATAKTLSFFAKSTSKVPKIIQILFNDFKTTIPKFDTKITPKLYYGKSDFLVFEDLTWQGFQPYKFCLFNLDHVKLVLGVLAKFHAGSLACEEIKSQKSETRYRLEQEYNLDHANINLKEVVDLLGDKIEDLERRQLSSKFRKTLCHSNLIPENIMFKYENGIPIECKLINFKSKHYAPPIYDVLQVIFFNTSEYLRQHHLQSLMSHYHNRLEIELKNYCLDIKTILPLEELQLAAHHVLPLIKLETVLRQDRNYKNGIPFDNALAQLKEILHCPRLTREDCYVIVKNKIGPVNYEFLSFTVIPLDQISGYLGAYHKLQIKIRRQSQESINCFVKCMPNSCASKGIVQQGGCFFKEVFIYQTLVPEMQKVGINTINDCLPTCYFQRYEDLMVFDDMSMHNYRMLPAQIPWDLKLLSVAIRKLARFHASSIIFEEKMGYRLNEHYGEFLREIFFLKDVTDFGAKLMQTGLRTIVDVIDLFPDLKTKTNEENFEKNWPKLQELFFKVIQTSDSYRNVLIHGDLWTNNIMVKFDGDQPIDCCFVDYQCTRYCPPAYDFLSILYLTTDRATRKKHEAELKLIYYDELGRILSSYNYEIGEIYPYQEFIDTFNYIKPQMVLQAIMYNTFCQCTSDEITSILDNDEACNRVFFEERKEYFVKMYKKSSAFRTKLRECILDLFDLCNSLSSI